MKHTITLSLALASFWWINSGYTAPLILSLAGASIIFVIFIVHKMDVIDHESVPVPFSLKLPGYYVWLTKEVILANISVVKHILLGNKSISPSLTKIKISQKTDLGKVIYANSITLTPGTVSIDIEDDQILVHALVQESIDDLIAGEMDHRISQLED